MEPSTQQTSPAIPIAIVVGFALIAVAIFITNQGSADVAEVTATQIAESIEQADGPRAVSSSDYIRGNPNAPIVMIEYSDYDCPFCKQYHNTMNQVMDDYGVTGRLAWVYRQFPISELHPNSPNISAAALCVGQVAGNKAFWDFSDLVFEKRDLDEQTNVLRLPEYAEAVGADPAAYAACLKNGDTEAAVLADMADGAAAGVSGTPYTILKVGDQEAVINGAQSYKVIRGIIENLLSQLDGTFDAGLVDEAEAAEIE